MAQTIKERVYEILESSEPNDPLSRLDDWGVTLLVILDVSAFILETSHSIFFSLDDFIVDIEIVSVVCFTILYGIQIWACTADPRYSHGFWGRLRYAVTPLAIIDLLAILPFYLLLIFPDVKSVNSIELLRLLRLLKLIRYSESLQGIIQVITRKKDELLMTLSAVFILLIFTSSVMFFAENKAQPEAFPSIPAAMWWGVVTLTTVGYGDIYPVTPVGKLFGAVLAFMGIGLFALPAGIIASGFSEEIQRRKKIEPISPPEIPDQKQLISQHIEQSAELMKICIETAKQKFGNSFQDEAILRDLATFLYKEATQQIEENDE